MSAEGDETTPERSVARRLWLCADDYGIAPGVDAAIRDLVLRGRLNATSVMVASPNFHRSEGAPLAILNAGQRRVAIGLHLTLSAPFAPLTKGYRPLRGAAFLPLAATVGRGLMRRLDEAALTAEIKAQMAAFAAAFGHPPDFVDGHQHVHLLPQVRDALLPLMHEVCPQAWVRQCGSGKSWRAMLDDPKGCFIDWLSGGLRDRADDLGIATNPTFSGTYTYSAKADFASLFPGFLKDQQDGGVVMCHPGFVDEELAAIDPLTDLRSVEYAYLASDAFCAELANQRVVLA